MYRSNSATTFATSDLRASSLNFAGKSGSDLITLAGVPTARLNGGIVPLTKEFAPITDPSPMLDPGITNTRQGSHTLLPSVTGSYVTGYPSRALAQAPCVKMRQ